MNLSAYSTRQTAHITESMSSLSSTIFKAFSEMESKYQEEIAQLSAQYKKAGIDTQDTRNERDSAIKRLHAAEMDSREWKHENGLLKSSLKQAETTIAQQEESIAQLKKDVNWWRDQARNWQEHFLRVEEARCTLSSRLEEFKEQNSIRQPKNAAPLTPVSRHADADADSDDASKDKQEEYPCSSPEPAGPSTYRPTLQRKKTPMPKTIKQRKSTPVTKSQRTEPPTIVHSRLVRQVQAVVTVKDEESDPEDGTPLDSPPPAQYQRRRSWKTSKNHSQGLDEDEEEMFDDNSRRTKGSHQGEEYEEEARQEDDDEDDELAITSQTHIEDEYTPPAKNLVHTPPPSKKRRRNNSHVRPPAKRRL